MQGADFFLLRLGTIDCFIIVLIYIKQIVRIMNIRRTLNDSTYERTYISRPLYTTRVHVHFRVDKYCLFFSEILVKC